jgi:hypothetical protein
LSQESEVLIEVCRRLSDAGIAYMVTGSIAGNFYALPRMTRDIDVVVEIRRKDAEKIVELFKDDFYIDPETVTEAIERRGMFNLLHNAYVIKIDLIVRKDSRATGSWNLNAGVRSVLKDGIYRL